MVMDVRLVESIVGQLMQDDCPIIFWYVFVGQREQIIAPAPLKEPAAHGVQSLLSKSAEKVPAPRNLDNLWIFYNCFLDI